MTKWINADLRSALLKWRRYLELTSAEQAREDLATEMAIYQFKNVVFNAFKYTVFRRIVNRDAVATKEDFSEQLYQQTVAAEM